MKKLLPIALISFNAFFMASCDKDKRAAFTLDKTEYTQGENIVTTNTTVKGSKYYRWNFGGTEIYEKAPIFVIPKNQTAGDFIISCEATNDKNSSSSARISSQTVIIKEAFQGKLIFWRESAIGSNTEVQIKLSHPNMTSKYDTITFTNSSDPNCSFTSSNAVFEKLKGGNYEFKATDLNGGASITGTITLTDGFECKSQKVF